MTGTPPSVPLEFQLYDSYVTDPKWQRYYTYSWAALTGLFVLSSTPYLYRQFRNGNYKHGWSIQEDITPHHRLASGLESQEESKEEALLTESSTNPSPPYSSSHASTLEHRQNPHPHPRLLIYLSSLFQSLTSLHIPLPVLTFCNLKNSRATGGIGTQLSDCCRKGYLPLTLGQLGLVGLYLAGSIVVILNDAQLDFNANRPGFIALAMLTPLFLLTTKNNPLGLLLGMGYEKLNWAHRWVGRIVWLAATIHGSLWLYSYRNSSALTEDKTLRGLASWIILTFLAITSIRPVRRRWYELFWIAHFLSVVGFFAAVCYHTPYSRPWIWPPVALYTADLVLRMGRYRLKDGLLVALDENFTMIHIPDCDSGWLPTQHIRIRVLAGSGIFESHPFTITNAPLNLKSKSKSKSPSGDAGQRGITLFAKVAGDWSRKLHVMAGERELASGYIKLTGEEKDDSASGSADITTGRSEGNPVPVKILIDGPYGGLKLNMADYQDILLIAGGSGITFVMGCVEECLRRGRGDGKRVEVVWVVRDMSTIKAFAPMLSYLHDCATAAGLELSLRLHLTRPPSPLPNGPASPLSSFSTLSPYRPSISQLIRESMPSPTVLEMEEGERAQSRSRGGVAVIACGPEGIVAESRNAVAMLGLAERVRVGGVDFHGEGYSI